MLYIEMIAACSETRTKKNYKRTLWGKCRVFRLVRKIAKSDYYLRHGWLSVRPHGKTPRSPVEGFS